MTANEFLTCMVHVVYMCVQCFQCDVLYNALFSCVNTVDEAVEGIRSPRAIAHMLMFDCYIRINL